MDVQKGTCFLCHNLKVIKRTQYQEAFKIISILLPSEVLNPTEFRQIQPTLNFCPICYHKLILLKRTSKHVQQDFSNEVSESSCLLCKKEKHLLKLNNWPSFNDITKDLNLLYSRSWVACLDCFFYLETKNDLKTKLLSKYPQLSVKTGRKENIRKFELKFTADMKLKKSVARKQVVKNVDTISISLNKNETVKENVNLDLIKTLKPLKDHTIFKYQEVVKNDSKLLNQIPYVLLSTSSQHKIKSSPSSKSKTKSFKRKIKVESESLDLVKNATKNIKIKKKIKSNVKSWKSKNHLERHGIINKLVVNLARIKMQNICPDDTNSLTDSVNNTLEEAETSFEVKNKRKSVSFAEERNIEIEYEPDSNFNNHINLINEEDPYVTGKKYNKGILKQVHEEPVEEGSTTSTADRKLTNMIWTLKIDKDGGKAADQGIASDFSDSDEDVISKYKINKIIEDNENFNKSDLGKINNEKVGNEENISSDNLCSKESIVDDISDDDAINCKTIITHNENDTNDNEEETSKRKPEPMSRMERRNTIIKDISDDDNSISDENMHQSEKENLCEAEVIEEENGKDIHTSVDSDKTVNNQQTETDTIVDRENGNLFGDNQVEDRNEITDLTQEINLEESIASPEECIENRSEDKIDSSVSKFDNVMSEDTDKLCEEVLNQYNTDTSNEEDNSNPLNVSKSDPMPQVEEIVTKYLSEDDNFTTMQKDQEESSLITDSTIISADETKETVIQMVTGKNNESYSSEIEPSNEIGLTEHDNENIHSLLSEMFETNVQEDGNDHKDEKYSDDYRATKRKLDQDESTEATERKKMYNEDT